MSWHCAIHGKTICHPWCSTYEEVNDMKRPPIRHEVWKHYKGDNYQVVDVVLLEADHTPMVVYFKVDAEGKRAVRETWVRPLLEFMEKFEKLR